MQLAGSNSLLTASLSRVFQLVINNMLHYLKGYQMGKWLHNWQIGLHKRAELISGGEQFISSTDLALVRVVLLAFIGKRKEQSVDNIQVGYLRNTHQNSLSIWHTRGLRVLHTPFSPANIHLYHFHTKRPVSLHWDENYICPSLDGFFLQTKNNNSRWRELHLHSQLLHGSCDDFSCTMNYPFQGKRQSIQCSVINLLLIGYSLFTIHYSNTGPLPWNCHGCSAEGEMQKRDHPISR